MNIEFTEQVGKSRRRIYGAAAGLFVSAAASGAAIASPAPEPEPQELPRAEIFKPIGVAPELLGGEPDEPVRVAIILDRQPVLEETTQPGYEAALLGYTRGDLQQAARRNPDDVSNLEAEAAKETERRRTEVVSALQDEVAAIDQAQHPVERAVEDAGGDIATNDLAATGALALVTAQSEQRDLEVLAARSDVQAIVEAPKPQPELNTSTTTIGAASVCAQHSGGGDRRPLVARPTCGQISKSGWTATPPTPPSRVQWSQRSQTAAIPVALTGPRPPA